MIIQSCIRMAVALIAALALVLLAGCGEPIDHGACKKSHVEPGWLQMLPITSCQANGGCTTQFMPIFHPDTEVCDQWEFPEGRPKISNIRKGEGK